MYQKYEPSGKLHFGSLILAPLFALPTMYVTAWIYVLISSINPLVILDCLLTMGYAFAVGGSLWLAFRLGHCRSFLLAVSIGLLAGLGAFYLAFKIEYPTEADVQQRVDTGIAIYHGRSETALFSIPAYAAWGLEFVVVVLVTMGIGVSGVSECYCEKCRRWMTKDPDKPINHTLHDFDDRTMVAAIPRGNLDEVIAGIGQGVNRGAARLVAVVQRCNGCGGPAFLTLKGKYKDPKQKHAKEQSCDYLERVAINDWQIQALESIVLRRKA